MFSPVGGMAMRTRQRRDIRRLSNPEGDVHRNAAAGFVAAMRLNDSAQRFDDPNPAPTFCSPIGRLGGCGGIRQKARPGVVHRYMQYTVVPMDFGTKRPRSIPLDVAHQFADDLLDEVDVILRFGEVGNVTANRRTHLPKLPVILSRISSPAHCKTCFRNAEKT